ncbi:MAG: hypothetical protein WC768_00745 [Patescibacteria group bacterium]|jgi:hypothetical protein
MCNYRVNWVCGNEENILIQEMIETVSAEFGIEFHPNLPEAVVGRGICPANEDEALLGGFLQTKYGMTEGVFPVQKASPPQRIRGHVEEIRHDGSILLSQVHGAEYGAVIEGVKTHLRFVTPETAKGLEQGGHISLEASQTAVELVKWYTNSDLEYLADIPHYTAGDEKHIVLVIEVTKEVNGRLICEITDRLWQKGTPCLEVKGVEIQHLSEERRDTRLLEPETWQLPIKTGDTFAVWKGKAISATRFCEPERVLDGNVQPGGNNLEKLEKISKFFEVELTPPNGVYRQVKFSEFCQYADPDWRRESNALVWADEDNDEYFHSLHRETTEWVRKFTGQAVTFRFGGEAVEGKLIPSEFPLEFRWPLEAVLEVSFLDGQIHLEISTKACQ